MTPQSARDRRVVPGHAQLVGRVVVAVDQVGDGHVGERGEAVGHAGRDEHAAVGCVPSSPRRGRALSVAPSVGRAARAGRAAPPGPAERARTSSRPGAGGSAGRPRQPAWRSPRLPWIISRPLREPLAAVGLDEVRPARRRGRRARRRRRRRSSAIRSLSAMAVTVLLQVDLAVVADHQPGRPGPRPRAHDLDLPADQRVLEAGDVDDAAVLEDDRVLDLGVDDLAVGGRSAVNGPM